MKIYFATGNHRKVLTGHNILASYWYLKKNKSLFKHIPMYKNFFLDSGAFTAFTQNEIIDIDDYIKMIVDNRELFPTIAGLDVIGNAEESNKNYLYMKSKGIDIIPTFHYGEDYLYLDKYCRDYDYIALGGVAQLKTYPRVSAWLDYCFSIIKRHWPKKVHGFALTGERYMKRYPFYSVDSSSWSIGSRIGTVAREEKKGMYKPLHYSERDKKNIEHFVRLENYITKLWEKRGVVWN